MARIRSIKPEFWTDEKIVTLTPLARLLFIGLWNFADDDGRMVYSPVRIKLQVLPLETADLSGEFGELRGNSLVNIYTVDGCEYLQIPNFSKHQKVDKRSPSRLPAPPPNSAESPRIPPTEGNGRDQGRDQGGERGETPAKRSSAYAFQGRVIRLTPEDFDRTAQQFHSIPDLNSELATIDAKFHEQGVNGNWFGKMNGWLNTKHQKRITERQNATKPKHRSNQRTY